MTIREPVVAGRFYPASKSECIREIESYLANIPTAAKRTEKTVAGIVPHAGWAFSGSTALLTLLNVKANSNPSTFLMYGAHTQYISKATIISEGAWRTPLGNIAIDEVLAQNLIEEAAGKLIAVRQNHDFLDQTVEVQLPFIKYLFPEAQFVPIAVPPDDNASLLGQTIGQTIAKTGKEVVIIGTSDLTHYGSSYYGFAPKGSGEAALKWVKEVNDKGLIDLILAMKAEQIVPEARKNHSACGGGAIAATVASAGELGSKAGTLLHYTTSYDVMPRGHPSDFVGYAAVVFQ